ncbi:ParB/RepB/Spo0J family partition protein [Deinococcus gobiensis]|uniref:ParB-like partition protein n=1 Tax=Deinococcus gobiensis (strain DSM 21396 / JCM 16679 / CGMCC 1.7299 / I-0) TaxID=745776 RepID=H8H0F5_DEIGI|nr:ParB/RepB/Spo0J family partition protein [Deinococcus gobiensis]AFD27207.1 ParB-like partition protein [Deinococcus gobiensis I-0]
MSRGPRPSAVKFDAGLTVAGLSAPTVFNVSPDQIQVRPDFNPRGQHTPVADAFSEPALRALGESMRRDGVLTPLIVSQAAEGTYWLIAGERRLRAARLAGLTTLPVMLKTEQDAARLALVENLQRQNLNPVDETFGSSGCSPWKRVWHRTSFRPLCGPPCANPGRTLTTSPPAWRATARPRSKPGPDTAPRF